MSDSLPTGGTGGSIQRAAMSVSRNEVMICGALIRPCEYYPQINFQWSTIFSSLGGSPWFPPQAIPSVTFSPRP